MREETHNEGRKGIKGKKEIQQKGKKKGRNKEGKYGTIKGKNKQTNRKEIKKERHMLCVRS
jgi:hypothetical protein